ncbi:hypothetical protein TIFTF001_022159 [Ficus carica]|uniref:Growth-regulating factor n=1 Tax=Ficus carica TaxID=3494 RepID=A0AA88DBG4_FICCA|nr:hypothetical protein TIFTF001_022159 [Ficus carica]
MGLGRKIDPEPGRCRRTDGKKWRCSKEAFPDSKYCERHMHRGKNRSRKPVEVLKSPSSSALTTSSLTSQTPNSSSSFSSLSSDTQNRHNLHYPYYNNTHILDHHQPMIYHHQPRTHHGLMGLSSQDSNTSLHFDSDWRNRYGDQERAFFSEEPSKGGFTRVASSMNDSWQLTPERDSSSSSWPDLDDKSSNSGSVSTTQLSISIPSTNSSYDFPIFTSSRTTHNGSN